MLTTTAQTTAKENIFTVTDGTPENTFMYHFGKEQDIQISKIEAERLAQYEIDKKAEPTPVVL